MDAYAKAGVRGYWQKLLEQTMEDTKKGYVRPFELAQIHARLGEKDRAFELLERAYLERDEGLLHLNELAAFDDLRSDPRFANLLRRVGLPQ